MSANEVLPDGELKELCAERGMCVGGQNVNEAFFQALLSTFEGSVLSSLMLTELVTEVKFSSLPDSYCVNDKICVI